jgi:CheY-like chemotaxis protein
VIKLLLADDSVTIQRVVELTFSGEDVEVISVGDGEQAILRLPAERPHIVLADIGMPKRNGYDVAAFVKGQPDLAHIPVVLLAGAIEPVDEQRARDVGSAGVLVKPFEPQQVIARVRELVEKHKALPATPAPVDHQVPHRPLPAELLLPEPLPVAPPEPERRAVAPEAGDGSLDDYFDRLDAAFATLGAAKSAPPRPPAADPFDVEFGGVTLPLLEPPDVTPTLAAVPVERSVPVSTPAAAGTNAIADVFRALLAAEQGDAGAVTRFQAPAPQPVVTDDLVEQVTRRVLERLAPDTARRIVADIVSEVAERLVREEIQRVKEGRPKG